MLFVLSFLTSLSLVILTIPPIVRYAFKKQFFEASGERKKIHCGKVPHFGGIAIYFAVLLPGVFTSINLFVTNWLLLASLLVFGVGLVDDLKGVRPGWKFLFQLAAASTLVVNGGVRISNLQGLLSYGDLTWLVGMILSVIFIVGIINAFNLIDGIDGLAASVALLICSVYAYLFYHAGSISMSYLSCSIAGALVGFLFFNVFSKRKIFMGDCGSLLIGLLVAFLSIKLLDIPEEKLTVTSFRLASKIGFVFALLSVPLFDTLRVFVLRVVKMRSPFKADDNHIHHRLLSLGLNHYQSTVLLVTINLGLTTLSLLQQALGNTKIILTVIIIMVCLNSLLTLLVNRSKAVN